jgi:hypothetical protein
MTIKHLALFKSTLPDDEIDEEIDGVIHEIQVGGKSVTFAVAEMLRGLGCEVDGPEYAYDHGWTFEARKGGRCFPGQVTLIHQYWLQLTNPSWTDKILGRAPRVYLELLQELDTALREDPRFSHVRWFANGNEAGKAEERRPNCGG